jgi:hypothetical protein
MRAAQLLLLSLLLTSAASAQTLEELAWLRLTDATPRATRAVALGGASDSLGDADMAANPATLVNVKRPMFVVQGARNSVGATRFFIGGDQIPRAAEIGLEANSVSQIAAAIPLRNAVIGVYYASEPRLAGPDPLTAPPPGSAPYAIANCAPSCAFVVPAVPTPFERLDQRYGLAGAWERGAFAFGVGAEVQRLRQETQTALARPVLSEVGVFLQAERASLRTAGRAIVPNAGLRWRATPRLAFAAAYNGGGSFTKTWRVCSMANLGATTCNSAYRELDTMTVRMPDAYRAGFSFTATERLRLVAEGVRRKWSRLPGRGPTIFGEPGVTPFKDTTELHAGAEYRVPNTPVALRAGWWRDPGHAITWIDVLQQSVTHHTIGAGIDVGRARLDVAYDDASLPNQRRAVAGITFGL